METNDSFLNNGTIACSRIDVSRDLRKVFFFGCYLRTDDWFVTTSNVNVYVTIATDGDG